MYAINLARSLSLDGRNMATSYNLANREFHLTPVGNRLAFVGHFDITQFRRALSALRELIEDRGYQDIRLDFSKCTFTRAPPMLALATASEYHQTRGIEFELILPEDGKIERLFRNSNWAHIIEPNN